MTGKQIVLIGALFLFSCGDKNAIPKGVLKPAAMQTVLWDVLRADAFTFAFITKDSTKKPEAENVKLQQQIFAEHKITREEFYKSYEFYKTHPALMQPLLDSMISKAGRDKYINTRPGQQPLRDSLQNRKQAE